MYIESVPPYNNNNNNNNNIQDNVYCPEWTCTELDLGPNPSGRPHGHLQQKTSWNRRDGRHSHAVSGWETKYCNTTVKGSEYCRHVSIVSYYIPVVDLQMRKTLLQYIN